MAAHPAILDEEIMAMSRLQPRSTNGKTLYIARHGETIFNAAARMQGMSAHTPLTANGCAQAQAMGRALAATLSPGHDLALLASPSGRTLQTLALICEETGHDWHDHATDHRLREIDIGDWEGQYYRDLFADPAELIDHEHGLFKIVAPGGGEDYRAIAARLEAWLSEQRFERDMLLISHGMTSRVLRGLLRGLEPLASYAAPIAPGLPQGSIVAIRDGQEQILALGSGTRERA